MGLEGPQEILEWVRWEEQSLRTQRHIEAVRKREFLVQFRGGYKVNRLRTAGGVLAHHHIITPKSPRRCWK